MSPSTPSADETPAPKLSSPVGTSLTSTVRIERSGAEPSLVLMSTLSKKPRFVMRCRERRIRAELKASPLHQPELPTDHLVEGADVAHDVDSLDIDPRTLVDLEGDVDGHRLPVSLDAGLDVDERVTAAADDFGERDQRLLDLLRRHNQSPTSISMTGSNSSGARSRSWLSISTAATR